MFVLVIFRTKGIKQKYVMIGRLKKNGVKTEECGGGGGGVVGLVNKHMWNQPLLLNYFLGFLDRLLVLLERNGTKRNGRKKGVSKGNWKLNKMSIFFNIIFYYNMY